MEKKTTTFISEESKESDGSLDELETQKTKLKDYSRHKSLSVKNPREFFRESPKSSLAKK